MTSVSSSSLQGLTVEVVVQDPATLHDRVFRCLLGPLRTNMRYFEPSIVKQVNKVKMASVTSASGVSPPVTLKARCDHRTFEWLLEWVKGDAPALTTHNVVNIALSSSFLQMRALANEALLYLRAHLPEIVTSSIDLTTLPMDWVLRLSRVVQASDLAVVLQHLYDHRSTSHPNRAFVASLLHHYVCYCLGVEGEGEDEEAEKRLDGGGGGDAAVAANGGGTRRGVGWQGGEGRTTAAATSADVGGEGIKLQSSSGLRWCRLCAVLFDQTEMQRLLRAFQLSAPECPAQTSTPSSPSTHASPPPQLSGGGANTHNVPSGGPSSCVSGAAATRCVGPRGEVFMTHAESRHALPLVLDAPPAVNYDRVACCSTTDSIMRLECWAWRIIGAIRYVSCRRCSHLVSLTDVPHHHCSDLPAKFASPDNVAEDVEHLVRWFTYCQDHRVYAEQGGLTAVLFNGPRQILAEEVVSVPLFLKTDTATVSKSNGCGENGDAAASAGGVPERRGWGGAGSAARPPMSFWATKPFYVAEVMDKGIVDIDIQSYVERQHRFEVETQQRKAAALFNPPLMRLSSSPALLSSSSSPSPRLVTSVSGTSSTASVGRGKGNSNTTRARPSARSPYGF